MDKKTSCAFTGHRENKLPWDNNEADPRCLKLKRQIADAVEAVYKSGVRHFLCGMAKGCDMYFCEAVIDLREQHPDVSLEAAVPYEGQSKGWDTENRCRYDRLIAECDYQTVIQSEYTPDCMLRRNRYMVDSACMLIAAYNGHPGGTQSTMLYAIRQGLKLIELSIED